MKNLNWDDVRLFVAVADTGGLSGAAGPHNGSPATVGRHITRLEETVGQALFVRSATGYELSSAGKELLAEAKLMEAAAQGIERWRKERAGVRTVRISAGSWTSWFLARHLGQLTRQSDMFNLAFVSSEERVDIARRHADIGIRNSRPVEMSLAGRAVGTVAFAAYRSSTSQPEGWIASASSTPSAEWVRANHADRIAIEANTPRVALDLCETGAGRAILPCFVGDQNPKLVRDGDIIAALNHRQWLVAHHEARNEPTIRTVLNRVAGLMAENKTMMTGEGR